MFHFTRRRIEAHICICFEALKVYKERERLLKLSDIRMSVDKVLGMAKTVTSISVYMPQNKTHFIKTMPMKRHKPIAKLFEEDFWEAQCRRKEKEGLCCRLWDAFHHLKAHTTVVIRTLPKASLIVFKVDNTLW